jgi:hypothetical protein
VPSKALQRVAPLAITIIAGIVIRCPASADVPTASVTVVPTPTASPHWSLHVTGTNVFVDQATGGPGATPPEGPLFAKGDPNAPMSPYDWFSAAPLVPGVAGVAQYAFDVGYRSSKIRADATFMVTGVGGSITNAVYWGEPLAGPIDPHEGRSTIPYSVVFPTHAGTDDTVGGGWALPYNASLGDTDGHWKVSAGYVQTSEYPGFVFTEPALTNWSASLSTAPFLSSGPGISDLDSWKHFATALPLLGADATGSIGKVDFEATDALLPSPPGTGARMAGFSSKLDTGNGGSLSFALVHVGTSGASLTVPALFGADPQLHPGAQGNLATSTLADQWQTIAGVEGTFHPFRGYDATAQVGRAWYDSSLAARPGTTHPGDYEHFEFARHFNTSNDLGIEYYRFDPHYASVILPYGVLENVWGIAWAYPGPWLKGNYQLVNDNVAGSNRMGLRAFGDYVRGKLRVNASYYSYRQVDPSTYSNLTQTGFVEVDYLTEAPGDSTFGFTHGVATYAGWNLDRDTIGIDYERDTQSRAYDGPATGDLVDMRYSQIVAAESHRFSKRLTAAVGYARYGADGMWSTTPVSGVYACGFLGAEWEFTHGQQVFVQIRRYGVVGLPSIPGNLPPTLRGTSVIVDHHISL